MSRSLADIRILLIQIRERADVADHEKHCICVRAGLEDAQIAAVNLVSGSFPDARQVTEVDAIIIGGSGVYSVTQDHPFSAPLTQLVRDTVAAGRPLLGACWGHQFIAKALGGEVITDRERGETGIQPVTLTNAGSIDPLFHGLPAQFDAAMGHNDRVSTLPPGAVELATSARCPNQCFRIADRPVYGTQFHAELSAEQLLERLNHYHEIYDRGGSLDDLRTDPKATPIADGLLRRWLELYVVYG